MSADKRANASLPDIPPYGGKHRRPQANGTRQIRTLPSGQAQIVAEPVGFDVPEEIAEGEHFALSQPKRSVANRVFACQRIVERGQMWAAVVGAERSSEDIPLAIWADAGIPLNELINPTVPNRSDLVPQMIGLASGCSTDVWCLSYDCMHDVTL